jgi:uncharacterized membrane protein HdeD (DUF308 family)
MSDRLLAGGIAAVAAILALVQLLYAFLNLAFFVGVFYLIVVLAGIRGRAPRRGASDAESTATEKRVA